MLSLTSSSPRRSGLRRGLLAVAAGLLAVAVSGCGQSSTGDQTSSQSPAADQTSAGGSAVAGPGSSGAGPATGPVTVDTAAGPLTLPAPATKVAVLQFQFLDMLLSLGVQPTMVADEQVAGSASPMPVQFEGKLGTYKSLGSRLAPNLEVLASDPVDLILVDKGEHLKDRDQFETYAPTAVLDTWGWSEFYPNLEKLGKLVGKPDQAAKVAAEVKDHFASGAQKLANLKGAKAMVAVATKDKFFSFTGNSLQAGVMTDLGMGYAYKNVEGVLTEQVPLESLAAAAPDVLFLAVDKGTPMVTDTWKGNALWDSIPAVKNGKVFVMDRGIWSLGRGPMAVDLMIDQTVEKLAP